MIYEMHTSTLKPRSVAQVESRFGEAYEKRRKYSEMAAFWHTEIGTLNQIVHVWPYQDLAERSRVHAAAIKEGGWPPRIEEFVVQSRSDIMTPFDFSPALEPADLGPFFEMRTYTYAMGELPVIRDSWSRALPARLQLSRLCAAWYSELGSPNKFVHIREAIERINQPLIDVLSALIDKAEAHEDAIKVLYQAYLDHLVLLVRGQTLSDDDLLELGEKFGELEAGSARPVGVKSLDRPEIVVVSNVVEKGMPIGSLGYGEAVWHSDMSFNEIPTAASLLYGIEVPPFGGNTGFANMYLALATLSQSMRQRLAGLTIKNDASRTSAGELRPGFPELLDIPTCPGPSHPIIRTHVETGQNCLYLGRRPNAYVNGLPLEESESLLNELWKHATRPELTWHHTWRVGDLLIWDNRCTMHHRDPFDASHRRILHKTQTKGERPAYSPSASSLPHARGKLFELTA